jgi:digeranylgeranylglycerophospholipid reductase
MSQSSSEDVLIVGGGPAGSYCAYELARKGISVKILDYSHPREKPCGGGISPSIVSQFPFVEKFRAYGLSFGSLKIISCTNFETITNEFEKGFCISRQIFDQGIMEMAIDHGAELIREKVIGIEKSHNSWKVKTNRSSFLTRILVGADGVNSIVRRKIIGPISKENLALTYGYTVTGISERDATIKFLAEIPGYIWVFPGKDFSKIGIGSDLATGKILRKLLNNYVVSNFPNTRVLSSYASMLPSASDPAFFKLKCSGESWLLIGDAAGHVDPISGGGILYALRGAQLAAEAISENNLESFDSAWRRRFGEILEEHTRSKDKYYDPLQSTLSIISGLVNKTHFLT